MAGGGESKTEKATPKKRKDERKKGNVFQSKDIITVASILIIFVVLKFMFPFIYSHLSGFMINIFSYIGSNDTLTLTLGKEIFMQCVTAFVVSCGLVILLSMIIGVVASGVQTKFIVAFDSIKPKFSRMNPLKGIQKLFSLRSVVELLKSMLKVILISVVLYMAYEKISHDFPKLLNVGVESGIIFICDAIMDVVIQICLVFGVIAFFDYLYQWWDYEKNLKMSKQEIKEEYKHMEGDPQVKGKIKERQRHMAAQRMMQAVPTADVVVRNPTHYAVALRYDIEKDMAPIVVAKGQDLVALKIIEIAEANNVPTTENVPLARALYASVDVNMPIPPEYYTLLAEVMAWVYSLKQKETKK